VSGGDGGRDGGGDRGGDRCDDDGAVSAAGIAGGNGAGFDPDAVRAPGEPPAAPPTKGKPRVQYAALPFRRRDGGIEVMLVTSRENRRWILPKGWPIKGRPGHRVAGREALEEAGLVGRVGKRPLGSYLYAKALASGSAVACRVRVYPLEVESQLDDWPEKDERHRRWLGPAEAAALISDPGLRKVLQRAAKRLRRLANPRRG
jgi:8-oxo-dGTP pyrophosphatase MutT (NUDIX family)